MEDDVFRSADVVSTTRRVSAWWSEDRHASMSRVGKGNGGTPLRVLPGLGRR